MKKLIVAAAVIGVASFAGVRSVEAQAPSRVSGSGTYPGAYGTYPSQSVNRYPAAKHAKKHHDKKHERRHHDHDADDARYGTNGQYGQYGYPNGTNGYPSTGIPQRVEPNAGNGRYNAPSRPVAPQSQPVPSRARDHDGRSNDRDR